MTNPTADAAHSASTPAEPQDDPGNPTQPDPPEAENNEHTESEPSPNSEAARWRTKLREAEAQRDTLTERLTAYQRKECETAVADILELGSDLFEVGGADVSDFYNDDGTLNEAELRAAAGALAELRPRLAKPKGPRWMNFGQGTPPPPSRIGWNDFLKG